MKHRVLAEVVSVRIPFVDGKFDREHREVELRGIGLHATVIAGYDPAGRAIGCIFTVTLESDCEEVGHVHDS